MLIESKIRRNSSIANTALLTPFGGHTYIGDAFADPFKEEYVKNIMINGKIVAVLIEPYVNRAEDQQEFLSIHYYSPVSGKWELFPGWTYTAPGIDMYAIHESGATFRIWYDW